MRADKKHKEEANEKLEDEVEDEYAWHQTPKLGGHVFDWWKLFCESHEFRWEEGPELMIKPKNNVLLYMFVLSKNA